MDDVLRKQWGFNGFIVTDYTGINEMIQHGMGDLQRSLLAMNAGIDMDMVGEGFLTTEKIHKRRKSNRTGNYYCSERILEAKYDLGFDDPYRYTDEKRSKAEVFNKANRRRSQKYCCTVNGSA